MCCHPILSVLASRRGATSGSSGTVPGFGDGFGPGFGDGFGLGFGALALDFLKVTCFLFLFILLHFLNEAHFHFFGPLASVTTATRLMNGTGSARLIFGNRPGTTLRPLAPLGASRSCADPLRPCARRRQLLGLGHREGVQELRAHRLSHAVQNRAVGLL